MIGFVCDQRRGRRVVLLEREICSQFCGEAYLGDGDGDGDYRSHGRRSCTIALRRARNTSPFCHCRAHIIASFSGARGSPDQHLQLQALAFAAAVLSLRGDVGGRRAVHQRYWKRERGGRREHYSSCAGDGRQSGREWSRSEAEERRPESSCRRLHRLDLVEFNSAVRARCRVGVGGSARVRSDFGAGEDTERSVSRGAGHEVRSLDHTCCLIQPSINQSRCLLSCSKLRLSNSWLRILLTMPSLYVATRGFSAILSNPIA